MRWLKRQQTNLASDRPYEIGAQWPDPLFLATETRQYKDNGQLTSGRIPVADRKDPNWLGLLRQYGRSIKVDLGQRCHVDDVQITMLEDRNAGIFLPDCVHAYASIDGTSWRKLGTADAPPLQDLSTSKSRVQTFVVACDCQARYIRVQCVAKVYLFVGGLSVHGRRSESDATSDDFALATTIGQDYLVDPATTPHPSPDLNPERTLGSSNASGTGASGSRERTGSSFRHMQLVYCGKNHAQGTWTVEDFWPMVVGLAPDNQPVGPLFDSALFLPLGKMETTAAAWQDWLDHLFAQNAQLSALDDAVARANEALGTPDRRVCVVLTLPGTNVSTNAGTNASTDAFAGVFGSIADGEPALTFNPQRIGYQGVLEQKTKALSWFLRLLLTKFQSANYKHLHLTGFYWQPESVNVKDPYDTHLIRRIADAIHAEKLSFFWIPSYGAAGFTEATSFGFHHVMLQPNAAFHPEVNTKERVEISSAMAEAYGAGLEMELHWDILSTDPIRAEAAQQRYMTYLRTVSQHPYARTASKAYYLGSKTLLECYKQGNPIARSVYDATVAFIVNGSAP